MKILLLIDEETFPEEDPLLTGKTDAVCRQMEFHIAETLRFLDHEVDVLPFESQIDEMVRKLTSRGCDLVFNLTEHVGGDRRKDMHVAALLELLGLPFTGSGTRGLMLSRDKAMCKRLLSHHRVRVPDFGTLPVGRLKLKRKLDYPLILKPVHEDGSDGISQASLVNNDEELAQRAQMLHERMNQRVICEEYIEGREIYVGIVGNQRLKALPARELVFGEDGDGGPKFATAKVKHDDDYRESWGIEYTHAHIPEALQEKAARFCKRVHRLLYLRDYSRVDLRVTDRGEIVFLEANANPDLSQGDDLAESWEKAGYEYLDLIRTIVNEAARRAGVRA